MTTQTLRTRYVAFSGARGGGKSWAVRADPYYEFSGALTDAVVFSEST
jgi:hypothetical protein